MHTIMSLRKMLGLGTTNQVRNRIDAVKDVLAENLRRGPNNQILLTDEGVAVLRQLQELYDSGLTMTEASTVVRAKTYKKTEIGAEASRGIVPNDMKLRDTASLVDALRAEIAFLRERVAYLEEQLNIVPATPEHSAWWQKLREDLDGS